MSTKKFLFEKNERYFIQGHVRMHTAKRKNSKVKIACRRADLLKWPYFRTSAILTVTFDLQTFVWDKNSRKVKTEPHIYLLRGFQNAQEIENRLNGFKNTEGVNIDPRAQCQTKIYLRELAHLFSYVKCNFRASFYFAFFDQNTPSIP